MAYIGTSPSNGVRKRFVYVAEANQKTFSGNDENGISLVYVDVAYLDVYQNGVKLKSVDDYASTTGTSVVLVQGASVNDVVEIIAFDVFSIGDTVSAKDGGSFGGNVGMGGTLAVTGNTTVGGTLGVTGAVTLSTKLATTNLAVGAVVQVKNVMSFDKVNGTTAMPEDDTIPQNNEGVEFLTLAITPTSATNKLKIEVHGFWNTAAQNWTTMALFQDSTANALNAVTIIEIGSVNATVLTGTSLVHFMDAGTTSATTFKVRVGNKAGGNVTMNGVNDARKFGGVMGSGITITEIAV